MDNIANYLLTALGIMVLMLVAYDVYATILHARKNPGPISDTLNRTIWFVMRFVAFRLPRARRHQVLNSVGPLLLPLLIGVFIFLLIFGYALIYLPQMPGGFNVDAEALSTPWIEALYFSGITLTTVGYGDIAPSSAAMRAVALVESASGFALISLAATYLVTVYSALERKRAVARSFYHQAEEGADVAGFLVHHFVQGKFYGLDGALGDAARELQALSESHIEHPVIHFFHTREVYKSLPRMLFLALEICAVIQTCLDRTEYVVTHNNPQMRTLQASARHMLAQMIDTLRLENDDAGGSGESQSEVHSRWQQRFQQTTRRLEEAGIRTNPDQQAAFAEYRTHRQEWEARLFRFAFYVGYDWDEVTGDHNLKLAADETAET